MFAETLLQWHIGSPLIYFIPSPQSPPRSVGEHFERLEVSERFRPAGAASYEPEHLYESIKRRSINHLIFIAPSLHPAT